MKVTGISTRLLSIPFRRPDAWSAGAARGITTVLVLIDTDEGLRGIGEANGDRSARAVAEAIETMAPYVIGRAPFDLEPIVRDLMEGGKWRNVRPFANQAIAGIDIALWDIIGQAAGQPVCNLLGGRVHREIDFFWYVQRGAPDAMAAEALRAVADGYEVLYIKIGVGDAEDLAAVAAVRDAVGPGPKLRVDANEAWAPGHAVAMAHRLEPYGIDFLEQPTTARDFAGLAAVRARSPIAIAANQSAFTVQDVLEVIRHEAADLIVTGPHQAGGLLAMKKAAIIAEAAGLPINRHAVGECGVGAIAGLHVCATMPNLTDGNQTHHQLLVDDVLETPLVFRGGKLDVPTSPGLGITLDWDKVERFAEAFEDQGQITTVAAPRAP